MVKFHESQMFRAETNPLRGSVFVVHKPSGRSIYLRGRDAWKFNDALSAAWNKFADGDQVYNWIWINCGFHRYA